MTNAEARFNNSLRPRKPEGSLGRTAQDGHLDSHTAPELCKLPPTQKAPLNGSAPHITRQRGCFALSVSTPVSPYEEAGGDLKPMVFKRSLYPYRIYEERGGFAADDFDFLCSRIAFMRKGVDLLRMVL